MNNIIIITRVYSVSRLCHRSFDMQIQLIKLVLVLTRLKLLTLVHGVNKKESNYSNQTLVIKTLQVSVRIEPTFIGVIMIYSWSGPGPRCL